MSVNTICFMKEHAGSLLSNNNHDNRNTNADDSSIIYTGHTLSKSYLNPIQEYWDFLMQNVPPSHAKIKTPSLDNIAHDYNRSRQNPACDDRLKRAREEMESDNNDLLNSKRKYLHNQASRACNNNQICQYDKNDASCNIDKSMERQFMQQQSNDHASDESEASMMSSNLVDIFNGALYVVTQQFEKSLKESTCAVCRRVIQEKEIMKHVTDTFISYLSALRAKIKLFSIPQNIDLCRSTWMTITLEVEITSKFAARRLGYQTYLRQLKADCLREKECAICHRSFGDASSITPLLCHIDKLLDSCYSRSTAEPSW